jgi:hypothetical protein
MRFAEKALRFKRFCRMQVIAKGYFQKRKHLKMSCFCAKISTNNDATHPQKGGYMSDSRGITVTLPNLLDWARRAQEVLGRTPAEEPKEEKPQPPKYKNEFSKISFEFVEDLEFMVEKYPLISLISVVAFGVFAISSFFSISLVGFISAGLYATVSISLAKGITKKGGPFWSGVMNSVGELLRATS